MRTKIYVTPVPADRVVEILPENYNRVGYIIYTNSRVVGAQGDPIYIWIYSTPNPVSIEDGLKLWDSWRSFVFQDLEWPYVGKLYARANTSEYTLYASVIEWSKE